MLRRLFLILALAFLFGLGQQGAAVHAISHFAEEQGQSQDNKATHTAFCDKCVTYAALGNAVGVSGLIFSAPPEHRIFFRQGGIRCFAKSTRHYAARAPPSLV